jgi:biopolymer transport protein ExbD
MGAKLSSSSGSGLEVNAEPNVIPFIDVMLVLLIIFMVAAPISSVDINVALPQTRDVLPSKRPPKPTWVSLSSEGALPRVYVMNDEVGFNEVGVSVRDAVLVNTPAAQALSGDDRELELRLQRVYIRADGDIQYRQVLRVMNELQREGFVKVALVAEDRRR